MGTGESGLWRPAGEAEATSNMAVFVEWLRATGQRPGTSPDDVRAWWAAAPDALLAAIAAFAGVDLEDRALLPALARHLLVAETRAGDTLAWRGDPDAAWPRAARAAGATVALLRPEEPDPDEPATRLPSSP